MCCRNIVMYDCDGFKWAFLWSVCRNSCIFTAQNADNLKSIVKSVKRKEKKNRCANTLNQSIWTRLRNKLREFDMYSINMKSEKHTSLRVRKWERRVEWSRATATKWWEKEAMGRVSGGQRKREWDGERRRERERVGGGVERERKR